MSLSTACEREIETLHDLFVRWYCGRANRGEFERVERALDDSFELVSPDGTVTDRAAVLGAIRDAYNSREGFDIEIRNVEPVFVEDEHALVRYEEWQFPDGEADTGRLSTALFETVEQPREQTQTDQTRPAARWLHLQETWLEGPDR